MACKYTYNGQTYTKDEFYSLVRTTMVQPKTVQKYTKILFPSGNTASKVEGHTTLQEFKKQKENRIKELEADNNAYKNVNKIGDSYNLKHKYPDSFEKYVDTEKHLNDVLTIKKANAAEIAQLKQELERVETEGFGALKPIYNFYENAITNILKKQFGAQLITTTKFLSDVFTPNGFQIVFGHPTIGKTYLKNNKDESFITLDDDYADEINLFVDSNRGNETRQEYKGRKPKEYNDFMNNLFNKVKKIAKEKNKPLLISNTNVLKSNAEQFDIIINIPKDEFKKRFDARGATYGFEDWKSDIDTTISNIKTFNKITDEYGNTWNEITLNQARDLSYIQFQKLTAEEKSKTIEQVTKEHRSITALKDLSAKFAHRIGGKIEFVNRTDVDWKGYNQGMTSVLNEAYMTLDTPFHEILAHPIIRAIKNKNVNSKLQIYEGSTFIQVREIDGKNWKSLGTFKTKEDAQTFIKNNSQSQLYQSLLKELETGRGKEVFEQVKRDYKYKKNKLTPNNFDDIILEPYDIDLSDNKFDTHGYFIINNDEYQLKHVETSVGWDIIPFKNNIQISEEEYFNSYITEFSTRYDKKYTLEEQQEEAIVTLLGMMASDKLDAKKDATLISKLKELWKQISDFVKSLLRQDGIKIDELPITTTLNDLAEIMAYGNNKIILPGYKVEYSTPLGNKYDTLEEVNNEIRGLADANVEVDLSGVKINPNLAKEIGEKREKLEQQLKEIEKQISEVNEKLNKLVFSGEKMKSKFEFTDEYKAYLQKYKDFTDKNLTPLRNKEREIHEGINDIRLEEGMFGSSGKTILNFIQENKEYEQSKEIIEKWKKENNIQYDPEEVYSRGQGFYSSIGAYSNLELDLLLKNLIQHIEDNKKAGGEFTISAFTKPIDKRLKHIEGTGDRVRFVIYPQSEHIKWAAPTDVYSGSVWDAHEKVSKDKKSELLGVSFTKAPALRNINEISPNLADIIDNLSHAHNELGIELTTNNFRIEYDDNIDYSTKKLIDNVNKILDDKYGKLDKLEIKVPESKKITKFKVKGEPNIFNTREEAQALANKLSQIDYMSTYVVIPIQVDETTGKQPIQTKENTTSIESVRYKLNKENYSKYGGQEAEEGMEFIYPEKHNKKEYTSQAEINLKVAALKEVARKYPRSLITSKVVPINPNMVDNSEIQYSKKQGYNPIEITDEYGNTWNEVFLSKKHTSSIYLNPSLTGQSFGQFTDDYYRELQVDGNGNISIDSAFSVVEKYGNQVHRFLINKFRNYSTDFSIIVDNTSDKAAGYYNPETRILGLNLSKISAYPTSQASFAFLAKVITHELVHHYTLDKLRNKNSSFYKEMYNLYGTAMSNINNVDDYGFTNIEEFVAEALTNTQFQTKLTTVPYKQTKKSLWETFMDLLRTLFSKHLGINSKDTLLEEVVSETIANIEEEFGSNKYFQRDQSGRVVKIGTADEAVDYLKQRGIINDNQFRGAYWVKKTENPYNKNYSGYKYAFKQNQSIDVYKKNKAFINQMNDFAVKHSGVILYIVRDTPNGTTVAINPEFFRKDRLLHLPADNIVQAIASENTQSLVRELAEKLGITIEKNNNLVEKYGAFGVADTVQKLIQIVEGKENVALTEEFFHVVVDLLPEDILNPLLKDIVQFPIYQAVKEVYKDVYTSEEQFLKEAIGKYLADVLIYKVEKPSNYLTRLWDAIKAWFNSKFKLNPFTDVVDSLLNNTLLLQDHTSNQTPFFFHVSPADIAVLESTVTNTPYKQSLIDYIKSADEQKSKLVTDINALWADVNSSSFFESNIRTLQRKGMEINTESDEAVANSLYNYLDYLHASMPNFTSDFKKRATKANPTDVDFFNLYHGYNISQKIGEQVSKLTSYLNLSKDNSHPVKQVLDSINDNISLIENAYFNILGPLGLDELEKQAVNRNTNYEKKIREKIKDKEDDLSKLLKLNQTQAVQNTIKRKEAEIKTLYDELEENLVNAKTLKATLESSEHKGDILRKLSHFMGGVSLSPNMFTQTVGQFIRQGVKESYDEGNRIAKNILNIVNDHEEVLGANISERERFKPLYEIKTKKVYSKEKGITEEIEGLYLPNEYDYVRFHNDRQDLIDEIWRIRRLAEVDTQTDYTSQIEKAIQTLRDFNSTNAQRYYTDEYYAIYDSLDPVAAQKLQEYQEAIDEYINTRPAFPNTTEMEIWYQGLEDIVREKQRLESLYDEFNNKKEGEDLRIAESISNWRKEKKSKEVDSYIVTKNNYEAFKEQLRENKEKFLLAEQAFNEGRITETQFEESKVEWESWKRDNVVESTTDKFERARKDIFDEVKRLFTQLGVPQNKQIGELWEEVFNLVKGYRDFRTGQLDSRLMHEDIISHVKDIEEQIEEIKNYLREEDNNLTAEEKRIKAKIGAQFEKLAALQESEEWTEAFEAQFEHRVNVELANLPTVSMNDPDFTTKQEALIQQAQKIVYESEWFKQNTIQVMRFGPFGPYFKTIPIYVNRVTKPIEQIEGEYLDKEAPSFKWKKRVVNSKYINKNYKDVAGNLQPKSAAYRNQEWDRYTPSHKELIQKLTDIYFEEQLKLPMYQRLGYELPHVGAKAATRILNSLTTGNPLQLLKDLGQRTVEKFKITPIDEAHEFGTMTNDTTDKVVKGSVYMRYTHQMPLSYRSFNVPAMIAAYSAEAEQVHWKRTNIHKLASFEYLAESAADSEVTKQLKHFLKAELKGQVISHTNSAVINWLIKTVDGLRGTWNFLKLGFKSGTFIKSLANNVVRTLVNKGYQGLDNEKALQAFGWALKHTMGTYSNDFRVNKTLVGEQAIYFRAIAGDTFAEAYRTIGRNSLFYFNPVNHASLFLKLPDILTSMWMMKLVSDNYLVKVNGKMVPILEAYELQDNQLVLKPNANVTKEQENEFRIRVEAFIKTTMGNYDPTDIVLLKQALWGRQLMNFNNYFALQFHRIWGRKIVLADGNEFEGYMPGLYRSNPYDFNNFIGKMLPYLTNSIYPVSLLASKNYTKEQKAHALAYSKDMTAAMLFAVLTYVLRNIADGSDDDDWATWALYYNMRNSAEEVTGYSPIGIINKWGYRNYDNVRFQSKNTPVVMIPFLRTMGTLVDPIIPPGGLQWSMSPYKGHSEWYQMFGDNWLALDLARTLLPRSSLYYPKEAVEGNRYFQPSFFDTKPEEESKRHKKVH